MGPERRYWGPVGPWPSSLTPHGETAGGLVPVDMWALLDVGRTGETTTLYIGALGVVLASLAVILHASRRSLFFGSLALLTPLLATADRNPVREVASLLLPGWSAFEDHVPSRALFVVVFALAVLVGIAVDRPLRLMPWVAVLATVQSAIVLVVLAVIAWYLFTGPLHGLAVPR